MTRSDPTLLGILNLSPESMVRHSIARTPDEILERAALLIRSGADLIELGARSITPDAPRVDDAEERARLLPALDLLKQRGYRVAVDTWSPATAVAALDRGVDLVGFTGAELGDDLLDALRASGVAVALTYMPYGDPYRMRDARPVRHDMSDIVGHLAPRVREARDRGIERIAVDPNVGIIHPEVDDHAKIHQQLDVLWNLDALRALDCEILLYAATKPERLARILFASAVLHAGPDLIRTHHPETLVRLLGGKEA